MLVRRFIDDDLEEVMAMARRFHAESPTFRDMAFDVGKVAHLIALATSDEDWALRLAHDDDGKLVGLLLAYVSDSYFGPDREAGDLAFYVEPTRRGSRAAVALIAEVTAWARRRGAKMFSIADRAGITGPNIGRFFARCGLAPVGGIYLTRL